MEIPGKSILTNKRVIDSKVYLVYDLHGFRDIRKLNAFMVLFEIRVSHATPDNPNPTIFESTKNLQEKLGLSERLLKEFKADLEKRGLVKRCRTHIWKDGEWRGTRTCLQFQDAGIALYWKIKSSMNGNQPVKPKKAPVLKYTDKDMENARFWFKCLRRYWQGSPGKLKQIGAWEKQKEIRANAARKAREKLQITAEEFGNILERISTCSDADFYFKTVLGPDKFNHKWANGTPAEQMREKVEELDKMQEKRNELTITENDIPENCTQAEEELWDIMWDVIGERLMKNFTKKGQDKFDEYYDCLANICTELSELEVYERNIAKMKFRSKDVKKKFEADADKHKSAYFYFLLDKYSYTDCLFTVSMIQDSWWEFWNRVEPDMSSQLREELTPRTFTVNEKD